MSLDLLAKIGVDTAENEPLIFKPWDSIFTEPPRPGAEAIAAALLQNSTLKEVDLSLNEFAEAGIGVGGEATGESPAAPAPSAAEADPAAARPPPRGPPEPAPGEAPQCWEGYTDPATGHYWWWCEATQRAVWDD